MSKREDDLLDRMEVHINELEDLSDDLFGTCDNFKISVIAADLKSLLRRLRKGATGHGTKVDLETRHNNQQTINFGDKR